MDVDWIDVQSSAAPLKPRKTWWTDAFVNRTW